MQRLKYKNFLVILALVVGLVYLTQFQGGIYQVKREFHQAIQSDEQTENPQEPEEVIELPDMVLLPTVDPIDTKPESNNETVAGNEELVTPEPSDESVEPIINEIPVRTIAYTAPVNRTPVQATTQQAVLGAAVEMAERPAAIPEKAAATATNSYQQPEHTNPWLLVAALLVSLTMLVFALRRRV